MRTKLSRPEIERLDQDDGSLAALVTHAELIDLPASRTLELEVRGVTGIPWATDRMAVSVVAGAHSGSVITATLRAADGDVHTLASEPHEAELEDAAVLAHGFHRAVTEAVEWARQKVESCRAGITAAHEDVTSTLKSLSDRLAWTSPEMEAEIDRALATLLRMRTLYQALETLTTPVAHRNRDH